jgi:hypothetical protein
MSHGNGDTRMVRLAELWERTSARGTRYFSSFMGGCQVLMFDGGEQPHPTKPDETVHVWRLMVQERDPARRPQAKPNNVGVSANFAGSASSDAPAKPSARPVEPRDGRRGLGAYRRPANARPAAPVGDGGAPWEDSLEDIGR